MALGLFFFGANIVALTANLLTGAGVLIANPRSFNARLFAGVTVSAACYLVGRLSYAVPADVQVSFYVWPYYLWPYLVVLMNVGTGFWMILAYSLFQDARRIPRWLIAAFAVQAVLSAVNAFGYAGRDTSVLQSDAYPAVVNFLFGSVPIAMQSVFAVLALYWAARGWRADLDEGRRVLRGVFLVVVGGLSFGINVTELYLVDATYASRAPFDNVITLVMAAGYVTVVLAVLRFDARVLERLLERAHPAPDRETDSVAERDFAARGWRADLDEGRRVLRGVFLLVVGGLSFGINVTELYLVDAAYASRAPFDNVITLVMAAGYVTVVLAVLRFDARVLERLLERAHPVPDSKSDSSAERDFAALTRALNEEKVYLTHGLSIGALAKQLAVPEYRLRALINKRLGYRNFNALLHEHRLRDACAQLADPAKAHLPILTIALDVGYQSIAPFNQAFRDAFGCTPSEYRRKRRGAGVTVSVQPKI